MGAVNEILGVPGNFTELSSGAWTIPSSMISPDAGDLNGAKPVAALLTVEDNSINFTLHGVPPTHVGSSNIGHQMDAGESFIVKGITAISSLECIERTEGSLGKVKITIFYMTPAAEKSIGGAGYR